jgi:hypothetical protein
MLCELAQMFFFTVVARDGVGATVDHDINERQIDVSFLSLQRLRKR